MGQAESASQVSPFEKSEALEVFSSYSQVVEHENPNKNSYNNIMKTLVLRILSMLLLSLFWLVPTKAQDTTTTGDFHICYFSLNNEKEVTEMQKFTKKIKEHTHCSISVKEYLTEGDDPEESFKKMLDSGVRCDGLVISGHHTGAFGGKRSSGSLGIDFLEKLSCDPKYSKWFNQVNALWLQGCRTLGTGEIAIDDEEASADHHTARVGAVLEEDHLEQSIADLNMEFSATLDQDNPLSSRFLRAFPGATVFGWTKTAPGERAGSQYSIPFHIAHISRLSNNQDGFPSDSPIKGTWTKDSAIQYMTSMVGVLNWEVNIQCKELAVEAWKEHGKVQNQATEYGFYNPDLNAYKPLQSSADSATLAKARFLDCLLKNSKGEEFLKALDEILKDPQLIRYTYNALLERLKGLKKEDPALYQQVLKKLKASPVLKQFLAQKLTGKRLGILRKIDYLAFYEEVYGKSEKLQSAILDKASEAFEKIPSSTYNEIDYKMTLLSSLGKHGYLNNQKGLNLLSKIAKDSNPDLRARAVRSAGQMGEKGLPILEQAITDSDPYVRKETTESAGYLGEKGLPILEQAITDSDPEVRGQGARSASEIGEKGLPILEQAMKDSDPKVRQSVAWSVGKIGEKGLPIVEQAITDSDPEVREGGARSAGEIGEKGLPILEQAMKDSDPNVRRATTESAGYLGEKGLPILEQAITDSDLKVRRNAAKSAGEIGEKGLPVLKQAMKDSDPKVRRMAAYSASYVGEKGLPVLEQAITDSDPYVRKEATESAGYLGEKGLPVLEQAITDSDIDVRKHALRSARIVGEKALPLLQKALDNPEHKDLRDIIQKSIQTIQNKQSE